VLLNGSELPIAVHASLVVFLAFQRIKILRCPGMYPWIMARTAIEGGGVTGITIFTKFVRIVSTVVSVKALYMYTDNNVCI
jgi:hypothetical protein